MSLQKEVEVEEVGEDVVVSLHVHPNWTMMATNLPKYLPRNPEEVAAKNQKYQLPKK